MTGENKSAENKDVKTSNRKSRYKKKTRSTTNNKINKRVSSVLLDYSNQPVSPRSSSSKKRTTFTKSEFRSKLEKAMITCWVMSMSKARASEIENAAAAITGFSVSIKTIRNIFAADKKLAKLEAGSVNKTLPMDKVEIMVDYILSKYENKTGFNKEDILKLIVAKREALIKKSSKKFDEDDATEFEVNSEEHQNEEEIEDNYSEPEEAIEDNSEAQESDPSEMDVEDNEEEKQESEQTDTPLETVITDEEADAEIATDNDEWANEEDDF